MIVEVPNKYWRQKIPLHVLHGHYCSLHLGRRGIWTKDQGFMSVTQMKTSSRDWKVWLQISTQPRKLSASLPITAQMWILDSGFTCLACFAQTLNSALAMVLWYHPLLISERSPVGFRLGAQKLFSLLFRCYLIDWCHTLTLGTIYPSTKIGTRHRSSKTTAWPANVKKNKVLPLQSTGEKRKEEINYTVQLVSCQYWYIL
jgi:hypothetical protein